MTAEVGVDNNIRCSALNPHLLQAFTSAQGGHFIAISGQNKWHTGAVFSYIIKM